MSSTRRIRPRVRPRPENWAGLQALAGKLMTCEASRAGRAIVDLRPFELQALGKQLARIADGESAADVFKQDLATWRRNKSAGRDTDAFHYDKQACALLYWKYRCDGRAQVAAVIAAISEVFIGKKAPAPKTILKIAGMHKEQMLDAIAGKSVVRLPDGSLETKFSSGVDVSQIRESIERKSRTGRKQ